MVAKIPGAGIDANGEEIILDADADTTISADTDDQIDIKIAGADDFQFTANTFTVASGSTVAGALRPSFHAYKNTGQTIANNTNTTVTWEVETFDSDGKMDITTNERFEPTVAGYYYMHCMLGITNMPADKYCQIRVQKNDSDIFTRYQQFASTTDAPVNASWVVYLDADDHVRIQVRQNSGSDQDTRGDEECSFLAFRIH